MYRLEPHIPSCHASPSQAQLVQDVSLYGILYSIPLLHLRSIITSLHHVKNTSGMSVNTLTCIELHCSGSSCCKNGENAVVVLLRNSVKIYFNHLFFQFFCIWKFCNCFSLALNWKQRFHDVAINSPCPYNYLCLRASQRSQQADILQTCYIVT